MKTVKRKAKVRERIICLVDDKDGLYEKGDIAVIDHVVKSKPNQVQGQMDKWKYWNGDFAVFETGDYVVIEEEYDQSLQKEVERMKAVNQMMSIELAELRAENDRLKNTEKYEDVDLEDYGRLSLNNKVATKIVKGNIIKGNILNNKVRHIEPDERDILIEKIKEQAQFRFMDSKVVENIRLLLDEYEYPYKKETLNEDD